VESREKHQAVRSADAKSFTSIENTPTPGFSTRIFMLSISGFNKKLDEELGALPIGNWTANIPT
jgi:hypothetical protein